MIARLTAWICLPVLATAALPSAEPLWSLQPFALQPVPVVKQPDWTRSRVDHFILARLEREQLTPNGDAEPLTLLRRVYFDLIGLPPPLEEIEGFEMSKFAAVVDQLLASPEFGARWGRHWLDVARYAETSGNTRNMAYVLAWRYRNYVVRALNRDTPFDEFIREQIAGDLLPAASDPVRRDDQLLATGFLNVGVKSLGEQDKDLYDMNVADDQIDATCHAFLALSANCARCHDHKFDPIPTADYHALAGIFRSTQNLSGVQTNNVLKEAEAMPLGKDGMQRLTAVKQHEKDIADMQKDYVEVAKKRSTVREELIKAGIDPAKKPAAMPKEMAEKMATLGVLEQDVAAWQKKLAEKQKSAPMPPPLGMSVRDGETPIDCPVFDKGEIKKPLAPVKRGALSAIPVKLAPIGPKESGRRQLADWIASPQNPLTARVIVNRVWLHVFGRGLVDSPDDFGKMGMKPSHPELLDDLAARFVKEGWSIKGLIRELVLSRTYQMSSSTRSDAALAQDPSNLLLWRANRKRLEAEPLRDAMLHLGGTLDLTPREGSPIADKAQAITPQGREVGRKHFLNDLRDDTTHRSIYLPIVRGAQLPMMQCFNAADPGLVIGGRSASITPVQSLLLMNSDLVMKQAEGFAKRVAGQSLEDRIERIWKMACCREPTEREIQTLRGFIMASGDNTEGWRQLCHAVMQSGEFQTVY
ncbi:DUF1549 and DUF1553 domain-containing protein [Prosthecobacter sp.]|uniref:DUF1549 and DUF1553 domain-containing protein n=1 Tax=Prosthecobacter sp. TaxID=1965333 RepID=UPI002AB87B7E|nr:DUF1549 and DUF1553 domain-containing protein [Prosthecobacter sp.]MDZ4404144.1 DUF1549 and DUF1553 domain-containing protein [Prosthecobacter sp.]